MHVRSSPKKHDDCKIQYQNKMFMSKESRYPWEKFVTTFARAGGAPRRGALKNLQRGPEEVNQHLRGTQRGLKRGYTTFSI